MSIRLMVLGAVDSQREAHGYWVYRELRSWQAETWSKVRPGSIYHALTQLTKQGMLRSTGTSSGKGGPARTNYRVTATGRTELIRLVEEALIDYDQEDFAAGLAFMHLLPRARAVELAKRRLAMHEEAVAFMSTLPTEQRPTTPAKHPEIVGSWTMLLHATESWLRGFVNRLEQGDYQFADETSSEAG